MKSLIWKGGVILLLLAAVICWVAWPKKLPLPSEENRMSHPDGYSIIAPAGWTKTIETEQATLTRNKGWLKIEPIEKGYYPPSLMITVLYDPPNKAKLKADGHFNEGTFLGQPALVASTPQKKYWTNQVIFFDQGRWFQINLSTPDFEALDASGWKPYLESFRYDPARSVTTTAPTSRPALGFTAPQTMPAD